MYCRSHGTTSQEDLHYIYSNTRDIKNLFVAGSILPNNLDSHSLLLFKYAQLLPFLLLSTYHKWIGLQAVTISG